MLFVILLITFQTFTFAKYDLKKIERQVKYYSEQINDKNPATRLDAVNKLAELLHKKTILPLSKALNDPNVFVRKNAIKALGNLPYRDTAPYVINRLKKEKNLFVLREGVISLGKLKDQRGKYYLEKLTKHKSLLIRNEAKAALTQLSQK